MPTAKWMGCLTVGLLIAWAGYAANGEGTAPAPTTAATTTSAPTSMAAEDPGDAMFAAKLPRPTMSYVMGITMARNCQQQGIKIDVDMVAKGMKDVMNNEKLAMSEEDIKMAMEMFQAEVRRKMTAARNMAADTNRREGNAFLEENKKKEGVVELPSGLQYKIITAGTGKKPTVDDTVLVNYKGTLINGTEFDRSPGDEPAVLEVSKLILGWQEALKLMPVGSKWQLFIPAKLAYLHVGSGRFIGPNATIIFELELVGIK
jgi:FKBP-type peptidyl-prolyl cis-trans isomerase FklB